MSDPEWPDPRYEWTEAYKVGSHQPYYIQGRCKHLETVPVYSDGDLVARLCVTCDSQLLP